MEQPGAVPEPAATEPEQHGDEPLRDLQTEPVEHDEPASAIANNGEAGYRLVTVRLDADGRVVGQVAQFLTRRVYSRLVVLRLAKYEACKLPHDDAVMSVVDPAGRCIAVLAGGTGRAVPRSVAMRTKRLLTEVSGLPERRRTSRRRTSRPVKKRRRR